MLSSLSGQVIDLPVPVPVGVRADQGEARLHGLVGQIGVPLAGTYQITAKVWLNSGDLQRNESFFLNLVNSTGATVTPLNPNAGVEKVVPDVPGPAVYLWQNCGDFFLTPGSYDVWMHHYANISGQYPEFLFEPITGPESVRIVDSLRVVFIPLSFPNRPPLAIDDIANTVVNQPVKGDLLTNDSDPDGDLLVVETTPVVPPAHGGLVLNPDGTFTYTPDPGYTGPDHFVYQVCDDQSPALCDEATVWIEVIENTPDNERPVANNDVSETLANIPVQSDLLVNDFDPDGDPLVVTTTPVVPPAHGSVVINSDGTFTYTPAAGFTGPDSFLYQVCDNVVPPLCDEAMVYITVHPDTNGSKNDAPLAADDVFNTLKNTSLSGSMAANDQEPNGDDLIYDAAPVTPPLHGTVVIGANGDFTYTPAADYTGPDYFVYRVCDDQSPALCDEATVYITILPPPPPPNQAPVAQDDSVKTQAGSAVSGNVLTNDSDPDGDPLVVTPTPVVPPAHGELILNPDGIFTYTPTPGWAGIDSFVYQVCDTRVPPLCDQATVVITVEELPPPPNQAPMAQDDSVKTQAGSAVSGNVLTNDSDPDGDPLVVTPTPVVPPAHGELILNPDGIFTYTPTPGWAGIDSFVYQVCDTRVPPLCDQATVVITVEAPPAPVPYIEAVPTLVTVGNPVRVQVMVDNPVALWDLWVYLADGEIDSSYGDAFVQKTVLVPDKWYQIDPDYKPSRLTTTAKQEIIKFEIRILDEYGNSAKAETGVMVHEANDLSLDRNTYEPDIQEPLQIKFRLSSSRSARLDLYDIAGRHISMLTEEVFPSGWTTYYWNGLTNEGVKVGSGVYIVTLLSDDYKDWKKFMIVR
ncbi:MAG TPA: Ig-like domain-containing protein [bacterium]|nr:Ig-like domain-containing protein [bacterium]